MLSVLLSSCSDENDTIMNNTGVQTDAIAGHNKMGSTDLGRAKDLYAAMKASAEYGDFTNAVKSFNASLQVEISFGSKAEWINWLRNNISRTAFTSVSQFETKYDNMIVKFRAMKAANGTLYFLLKDTKQSDLQVILQPEHGYQGQYQTQSECEENCMDFCESSLDDNDTVLDYTLFLANTSSSESECESLSVWAYQHHNQFYHGIIYLYNQCLGNC